MAIHATCDGMRRRDFLKAGVVGGVGLSLTNYLALAEGGQVKNAHAERAIFINLNGGPSHMDTFDLKPDSASEFRGLFNPIETNAPGVAISEHLPKLALCADKFVILRGVSHALGAHQLGTEYVNTGTRPLPSLEYPGYGAVVTKEKDSPVDLPPFVAIPNSRQKPGFLGVQYAPLNTGATPRPGVPFSVRGIALGRGLTLTEVEKRQNLLADLDKTFAGAEKDNQLIEGLDRFGEQAHYVQAGARCVRCQQGVAGVRQAVRRGCVRHELPAGHAFGRGGRAVRHDFSRRLGYASRQLPTAERSSAADARYRAFGVVQRARGQRPVELDHRVRHR